MSRMLCPVVVGRDGERAQLDAAVHAARAGTGRVVLVSGPPGVGKSRLLADVAGRAATHGMRVLSGRCVPAPVPVPYRPLAEALLAASRSSLPLAGGGLAGFRAALGWIVPEWRDDPAAAAPESPVVVAEALLRALHTIAGTSGCALLLEDLQWADPETLHAVEYLADHSATSAVLCVASVRDEPGDAMSMLARLDSRRAVHVLPLQPLDAAHVVEMAQHCLDAATLAPEIDALLRDVADGMPFLVEEVLAAASASGTLVHTADGWRLTAPLGRLVPHSFATTVHDRLRGLGAGGRRFLGAAALLGRHFDWRRAARAAACGDAAAHGLLERAVAVQLVAAQGGGFAFRHALTREAIIGALLPTERAELAARCLEALEEAPPAGDEWPHLAAELAEMCAAPDRAARFLLRAGRASLVRAALDTATAALQRASRIAEDPELRADVLEALAQARSAAGDVRATQQAVESLLDALNATAAPASRRRRAHLVLARCAVTATHLDLAHEQLERARASAGDEPGDGLAARVDAVAAQLAAAEGRAREAEELALRAADAAAATGDDDAVCEALEVASRCARTRDLDEAAGIAERALRQAGVAGLAFWRMRAMYQLGVVELFRGGGVETLRRTRAEAERLGAVATATTLDLEITAGLEAQHRVDEARRTCERCLEMARVLELRGVEAVAHAFTAIIAATGGARAEVERAAARCVAIAGDDPEILGAIWGDARAVASLALEDRSRARRELEQSAATYPPGEGVVPRLGPALLALVDAVEGRDPDLSRITGVTAIAWQGAAYLAYADAVRLGRAGRGAEAVEAARRGDERLASSPWYLHLVRRLAAEAAITDGWGDPAAWLDEAAAYFDGTANTRLASACRSLLRRTGVAVARDTQAARALPAALRRAGVTPREAEVLELVGEGLSNREIAGRLFLSERTVEQHVSALRQKLGVRTRAQMAVYAAGGAAAGTG